MHPGSSDDVVTNGTVVLSLMVLSLEVLSFDQVTIMVFINFFFKINTLLAQNKYNFQGNKYSQQIFKFKLFFLIFVNAIF